jgi:carboxyl-terminal processing protease
VQAIDYSDRDENGYVKRIPDSLTTEFKTANGRIVRDGGGITPDSVVEIKDNYSELEKKLVSDNIIFDYAVNFRVKHKNIAPPKEFVFDDYDDFKKFVKDANFTYTRNTEKGVKALVDIAKKEGYYEIAKEEFDALEKKLEHDIDKDLDHFKRDVKWLVTAEILSKYYYKRGFLSEMVKEDVFVDVAKEILNNKEAYKKILSNP